MRARQEPRRGRWENSDARSHPPLCRGFFPILFVRKHMLFPLCNLHAFYSTNFAGHNGGVTSRPVLWRGNVNFKRKRADGKMFMSVCGACWTLHVYLLFFFLFFYFGLSVFILFFLLLFPLYFFFFCVYFFFILFSLPYSSSLPLLFLLLFSLLLLFLLRLVLHLLSSLFFYFFSFIVLLFFPFLFNSSSSSF